MMTQADFKPLLKHGKVIVLDVRDQKDFDEGHIPWAKHIPLKQLAERIQESFNSYEYLTFLDIKKHPKS